MFQIPGVTYYQTTSEVLGKLYSNTMMMNLVNSRMAYNITNDTDTTVPNNELSTYHRKPVFSASHGGISVTREQWTDEESSSRGEPEGAKVLTVARKHTPDSDTNA